jgi:hypothetical protein
MLAHHLEKMKEKRKEVIEENDPLLRKALGQLIRPDRVSFASRCELNETSSRKVALEISAKNTLLIDPFDNVTKVGPAVEIDCGTSDQG